MTARDPQTTTTVVGTANILRDLPAREARQALAEVLARQPDLVGLQEWGPKRAGLLRETGSVGLLPNVHVRLGSGAYVWSTPVLGGCAVGARADRYDVLSTRSVRLSRPGHADKPDRPLGIEPPRLATMAVHRDRQTGEVVVLLNYHLVPGVQWHGRYFDDRPLLVARHRAEVRRLEALVAEQQSLGRTVHAVGDANLDGLRLAGLTSCWDGRDAAPTLADGRTVDDVFGSGRAARVDLVTTPSDHRAVIATR